MFTTPIHTNEQSIERVLAAGLPALLVFWRKDNAPSQQIEPTLNGLASIFAGRLLIARVDVQTNPTLVRRYEVAHVPTLVFVNGVTKARSIGVSSEIALRGWLDALLAGNGSTPPSGPSTPLSSGMASSAGTRPAPTPAHSASQGAQAAIAPMVLNDATFDKTIGTNAQPVLVDFWAPWCGPCRMVAPAIEQLAREFAGRATVAKLNVDDNPRVAQRFGISSIPALYIFKNGKVVERLVGAQPASALRQALAKHTN